MAQNRMLPQSTRLILAFLTLSFLCCTIVGDLNAQADNSKMHTLVAVGDIMLSGRAKSFLDEKGYAYPFQDTRLARIVSEADVAFANLEYPITHQGQAFENKQYTYRGSIDSLAAIHQSGFDLLSLANNHIMDYGREGLVETMHACRDLKLIRAGAGTQLKDARRLRIFKHHGIRYGLLAYSLTYPIEFWATAHNAGTAYGERKYLEEDIPRAASQVDILIVSFHWGEELNPQPKAYQIELAHLAADLGATVVLGHHPHVPQPIEIYRGTPIFYSLGNYAFGSMSAHTPISFVAQIRFSGCKPVLVTLYPINVNNLDVHFQPRSVRGRAARDIITHLQDISAPFGTSIMLAKDRGTIELIQTERIASRSLP